MNRQINTEDAPPPFSQYAQAMEVVGEARILHISGQVGISPAGDLPEDPEMQHELAWQNVFAVLRAAGMDKADIVDVLAMVSDHDQVAVYRGIRDKMLEGHVCASTMLVCGLASPEWKVEIAVKAARTD